MCLNSEVVFVCVCVRERKSWKDTADMIVWFWNLMFSKQNTLVSKNIIYEENENTHTHRTQHFSKQFLLINIIKILSQFSLLHSACCMLCCLSSFLILTKHRRHWQQQPKCLICFVTFWLLPMLHNNNKNYQAAKSLMMIINEKFASSHCMR